MINAIILALGLLVLAILLIFPVFSIFLLGFSVPIIAWTFTLASFEIPMSDLIALIILLAVSISILYKLLFQPKNQKKIKLLLFFPFAIFILSYVFSLFNHPQALQGLYYIIRWPILLYLAYIIVPSYLIDNEKKLKIAIWSLASISLIMTISGYLSLLAKDWQDSFFRLDSVSFFKIYPFGKNHNLIAEFLSMSAFLWLALKDFYQDIKIKKIFNLLFIVTLGASVLTFSRAAWISVCIQLIILIYWKEKESIKKNTALWLLSGLSIIILMLPILWRMQVLQNNNTSSTENRWLLTEIAYNAWQEKPILGQGAGRFVEMVENNIRFTAKYGEPIDSHGFLQKIATESGTLGIMAWLFLLITIGKRAITSLKKYQKKANYLLPLWIAATGSLVFQIFNTSYYKGKVWLPILIALIASELAAKKYGKKD